MKQLFLTIAVAVTAFFFTACDNKGSQNNNVNDDTNAIDTTAVVEEPSQPAELVVTSKGIDGILELGMEIEKLPAQVEGLYDKFEVGVENDEGVTTNIIVFTLGGKEVLTGISADGIIIDTMTITSDKVVLKSGDKAWHIGDKPDGMTQDEEFLFYKVDNVIADTDTQGRICDFLISL